VLFTVIVLLLPSWANSLYETWDLGGSGYGHEVMGIAMASEEDGWAVKRYGNLYHWDGEEWSFVMDFPGGGQYAGLEYYDPNHIYAYPGSGLRMYDGTEWSYFEPEPPSGAADMEVIAPDSIWVKGSDVKGGKENQSACCWDGVDWTVYNNPEGFDNDYLACLGFGSADEGWAGGDNGAMSHFYDGEWHAYGPLTDCNLVCSSFANPDYGFMAGEGASMTYLDGDWIVHDTGLDFTDCYAVDDEYIVIVLESGEIILIHYDNLETAKSTGVPLYSVHATAPNDIWAGGEDGFVCHWNFSIDVQPTSVGQIKAMFGEEGVVSSTQHQVEKEKIPMEK